MQGDDGVALVLALVFLLVVGLFATVALDKNASTSLVGGQVRDRSQLQYALDGAVDRTLQRLRAELVSGAPSTCTSPTAPAGGGTFALNGKTATWSCTTLAGTASATGTAATSNYAIVVTGTGPDSFTSSNAVNQPLLVSGSVYVAGPVSNTPGDVDLPKQIHVFPGDVVGNQTTSNCAQWDADAAFPLTLRPGTEGYLRACTEQATTQAYEVLTAPTPAGSGLRLTAGACDVYFPGTYASAPSLANHSSSYFVSGVYRFQSGALSVPNTGRVVGGMPAANDEPVAFSHQCSGMTDTAARSLPGAPVGGAVLATGVTWVFAGTSTFSNSGRVALHSPPPPAGGSVPVSIMALGRAGDPTVVQVTDPSSTTLLNGKLYAPDAAVSFFANSATDTEARAGIVAKRLEIGAPAGSALAIYAPGGAPAAPPPPFRTVVVEATDGTGSTTAKQRAVATISNYAPFTVDVLGWRSQ